MSKPDVFGPYRGGTYTRSYLTMFWLTTAVAVGLQLWAEGRWVALVVLAVIAVVGTVVLVGAAQSVLSPAGLLLVLLRQWVPWSDVADVLDPQGGDTELRLRLTDGTVLTAKGVPPTVGPAVRAILSNRTS